MSVALVITHKQLGGHKWSNTHCVQIGVEDSQAPTADDLRTMGAAATFTDANTNASPTNIIGAILAFERLLHNNAVQFTDVLVTDGKRNTGPNPSTMYAAISLSGIMGTVAGLQNAVTPGNVTLLVHRNVIGFGHKPGRLFMRGVINDADVEVGGSRMITFSTGSLTAWTTGLATAQGKLTPYLYTGTGTTPAVMYTLPIYVTPKQFAANPALPKVGSLIGCIPVNGFSIVGPVGRQVPRGRKRKKA